MLKIRILLEITQPVSDRATSHGSVYGLVPSIWLRDPDFGPNPKRGSLCPERIRECDPRRQNCLVYFKGYFRKLLTGSHAQQLLPGLRYRSSPPELFCVVVFIVYFR